MKRILIVEDDALLNKTLAYNLISDGWEVTSALDARTAADLLAKTEYDLVLLDINLPDGNGYDLCKSIKPGNPDMVVIFLTANDQESDQLLYSAQQMKTLDGILGQYQAGCGGLTREEVTQLADTGAFEKWGCTIEVGTARYEDSVLHISFVSPEMIDLMGYGKITGAYPQAANELCVERSFCRYFGLPEEIGQTIVLDLGNGQMPYAVTGILETENINRIFTVWISESAVEPESPYELRFRFAGSQGMEPAQLRADIEDFFSKMGISEDRTFYSSNYFGMVDLYLWNGMEVYVAAALIAVRRPEPVPAAI